MTNVVWKVVFGIDFVQLILWIPCFKETVSGDLKHHATNFTNYNVSMYQKENLSVLIAKVRIVAYVSILGN